MYNKINVVRHVEQRKCISCGKIWDIYVKKINCKKHVHFCPECIQKYDKNERSRIRRANDDEYKKHLQEGKKESHKRNIIHYLWFRAKQRAIKYGYEFNIEEADIIIPKICPILEVPIILGSKGNYEYTPSLDRIDNSKGYIKGNIQVISKKANSMKNSATLEELQKFCTNILRYSLNITEQESNESKDKEL